MTKVPSTYAEYVEQYKDKVPEGWRLRTMDEWYKWQNMIYVSARR